MEKKIIPAADFTLSKLKLTKGGGVSVEYDLTESVNGEKQEIHYCVDSVADVHPDLKKSLNCLRFIMARVFDYTGVMALVEAADFGGTKAQIKQAAEFFDNMVSRIEVRGVTLSGKDEKAGILISASFDVADGYSVIINSPRIKFAGRTFGFEVELGCIAADIEREVYAFLFEGKRAQLSVFGGEK